MNKQSMKKQAPKKAAARKSGTSSPKFATKATVRPKAPGQKKARPEPPDFEAQLIALRSNHAVLEMKMDGIIVYANEVFLKLSGYKFDEITGKHYSSLVEEKVRNSAGYANFWAKMHRGECQTIECKQVYQNGVEVWLYASFNPILDPHDKPAKLFMYATDITAAKQIQADAASQLKSISNYQAVIEFNLDGTIITANQNFLDATGYTLSEIQGRHHAIFVEAEYKLSNEYRLFWEGLGRGRAEAGQYRRVRRDGSDVWLQASYNPIFDVNGRPYKVIKYATDITKQKQSQADADSQLKSISAYQAVIEFRLDGTIVTANQNFLDTIGYNLSEIQGRHHSMFVDNNYKQTNEYRLFWEKLGRGEADSGQYKRIRKDGTEVWLQASYNPIFDLNGKPTKVIKYATDITKQKQIQADVDSQLSSISAYQAVIEFKLDGTIVTANQNFLDTVGYTLGEIQGRHHSIFVDSAYKQTNEYRQFWDRLGRGEAEAGQYKRVRRDGSEVWLQASYNPIFDLAGKPCKVIKYATDITHQKQLQADATNQLKSISQYQAVIEFKLDGTIVTANQNFLEATGYTLAEIQGRHHSIFVEQSYKQSNDYRLFWDRLGRGEADAGHYKRIRRNGTELWLQASYNPILDLEGHPCKVIKYATDITDQKIREQQMERAMQETSRVMAALASGDLSQSIQGTFDGDFAVLRDAVNGCVSELKKMITETSNVMKEVAAGDLRKTIQQHFEGEFGTLRDSVNSCIDHLRTTVERIRHSVSTMTVSSSEIATGNLDLSQRTEQQAASLSTTAGNMQQITQTVKQNADNAREANSLATGARQQAEKGGAVVTNAIAAMGAINEASKRIADIIGVIDEIAFQTNLLALNAAVEAARAGEQGRGFAVVASEVRNLAQRSAGAAKEIKSLIKDSVNRVEEGSRLVNESGVTLEQIVNAAKKVSDIIAEIAAASTQQSAGIEKVTEAIQQMDVAVQQNSALVEETSAASNMMDDQTRSMSTLIEFFKISENEAAFGAIPRKDGHSRGKAGGKGPSKRFSSPATSVDRTPDFAMADEF